MENVNVGDWVTYMDMSNPETTYEVMGQHVTRWGTQWVLQAIDTAEMKTSDLRQAGWSHYRPYVKG